MGHKPDIVLRHWNGELKLFYGLCQWPNGLLRLWALITLFRILSSELKSQWYLYVLRKSILKAVHLNLRLIFQQDAPTQYSFQVLFHEMSSRTYYMDYFFEVPIKYVGSRKIHRIWGNAFKVGRISGPKWFKIQFM